MNSYVRVLAVVCCFIVSIDSSVRAMNRFCCCVNDQDQEEVVAVDNASVTESNDRLQPSVALGVVASQSPKMDSDMNVEQGSDPGSDRQDDDEIRELQHPIVVKNLEDIITLVVANQNKSLLQPPSRAQKRLSSFVEEQLMCRSYDIVVKPGKHCIKGCRSACLFRLACCARSMRPIMIYFCHNCVDELLKRYKNVCPLCGDKIQVDNTPIAVNDLNLPGLIIDSDDK